MADAKEKTKGFWASLPGLITATASLIAAVGGVVFGLHEMGVWGGKEPQRQDSLQTEDKTEGWTIIGKAKGLDYRDMLIVLDADAPAKGRIYVANRKFRLISQSPQEIGNGGQVITLGMVCRGDRVKVLDLYTPTPSTEVQPVYAKLEARLEGLGRC